MLFLSFLNTTRKRLGSIHLTLRSRLKSCICGSQRKSAALACLENASFSSKMRQSTFELLSFNSRGTQVNIIMNSQVIMH